jgi:hypothetical protein
MPVLHADELKKPAHGGDEEVEEGLSAFLKSRGIPEEYAGEVKRRLKEHIKEEKRPAGRGVAFRDKLPERYVVLDHHGVRDPAEEPSSVVQAALAAGAKLRPLQAHLIHCVDLFDRCGPAVKRWAGPYGNSLNNGVAKYFGGLAPTGRVKDAKFLLADAVYSAFEADLPAFAEAFKLAEKLPFADLA